MLNFVLRSALVAIRSSTPQFAVRLVVVQPVHSEMAVVGKKPRVVVAKVLGLCRGTTTCLLEI